MASEVREVEQALLALAPRDRAAVIHSGLLSLDGGSDSGRDDAWRREFRRRIDEIEDGTVTLVPGDESEARIRTLLTDLHP